MSSPDPNRAAQRRSLSPVLRADDFRPLSSIVQVEFGAHSDGRPRRAPNEDHYLVVRLGRSQDTIVTSLLQTEVPQRFAEHAYGMVLADGLGSAGAGGLASRIAVTTLVHLALHYGHWNIRVDSRAAFEIIERLDWCYTQADQAIKERARADRHLRGMATRLTAAYSSGDQLFIARTGRPLAYVYRDGELHTLAADDLPKPESHEPKGPRLVTDDDSELGAVLSDAIGGSGRLTVAIDRFQLRDADTLMLCTEGLPAALGEEQIADMLTDRRRPEELCRRLIDAALEARTVENVTVILAQYRIPHRPG
jgi:serine/threonine protein phosphatase PrpC